MAETARLATGNVVEARKAEIGRGWLGKPKGEAPLPDFGKDAVVFLGHRAPDGHVALTPLAGKRPGDAVPAEEGDVFCRVHPGPRDLALWFGALVKDEQGYPWSLEIAGTWEAADAGRLLRSEAAATVSPEKPLSREDAEAWMKARTAEAVREAVQPYSLADLRDRVVLSRQWWETRLGEWLGGSGIAVAVREARWLSPEADQAAMKALQEEKRQRELQEGKELADFEAEQRRIQATAENRVRAINHQLAQLERQRELERMKKEEEIAEARRAAERAQLAHDEARLAQERTREQRLRQAQLDAEAAFKKEQERLRSEVSQAADEATTAIALKRQECNKRVLQGRTEIEALQHEAERRKLEHQIAMARLENELAREKQALAREEEERRRHQEEQARLRKAQEEQEALVHAQAAPAPAATAEPATPPAVDTGKALAAIYDGALASYGLLLPAQAFVQTLRQKAAAEAEPVALWKTELQTRSIVAKKVGGGGAKVVVDALPIDSPVQFQFRTRRAGYVTLINIGTSGETFVHVPNAYVGIEAARAELGRLYHVPGHELMPSERLGENGLAYIEVGPPGWEHLALVVSDRPLAEEAWLKRAVPDSPFVALTPQEFGALCRRLGAMPPGSWSAGVLSFRVG